MNRIPRTLLTACAAVVFAACTGGEEPGIDPAVEASIVDIGGAAADALTQTLLAHLTQAMSEGGPARAIEVCSTEALELTAEAAREQGVEIKRTSNRYRNPANAPDGPEAEVLGHFEKLQEETGELPAHWVQRVGPDEYRYYRPLTVAGPCLTCHGKAEDLDPAIRALLADHYPDDRATGYSVGDFRGVIRVSVPAERVEAAAR